MKERNPTNTIAFMSHCSTKDEKLFFKPNNQPLLTTFVVVAALVS